MRMKTQTAMTFAYILIFSGLIAGSLLLPRATASTISATVVIDPEKINIFDSCPPGAVAIATVKFPKEYRDRLMDINGSTVLLDGVIPCSWEDKSPGKYKAFFDRHVVYDYLWLKLAHMGYTEPFKNVKVELTVTGELYDNTPFEGSDIVFVSAK